MLEQIIGMEKQAAIDFIHGKGMTVRIAEEEGVANNLIGDYNPSRFNLSIKNGRVTSVTQG